MPSAPLVPLPIDDLLPQVQAALRERPSLLLLAPPGSGKTTRVPPALLAVFARGTIVVLEPRRLAARAAAARVAAELDTELGDLVGYQVRGDRRASARTRILFVTEGVLVRRLVQDPFLDGTACVVLDEFHERHLEGDLALAMLAEVRQTVRPDLALAVMSATLDVEPLRRFLPDAAVLEGDGRLFPVRVVHAERRDDEPLEHRVRDAIARALDETAGDVLVFLPGTGEIERCARALDNLQRRTGAAVLPLHGRLSPREQDEAIAPGSRRKVVLSTNVAESSLTIPGVTAVVDSGLARELRFDRGRGVDVLELQSISQASATQRAGRAGRTGPGVCYRLWTAGEERAMPARAVPDVQRVDLAGPSLSVRAFAGRDPASFGWYEAPPASALRQADELLAELGAVDRARGVVTARGRDLLDLPLHPRLGSIVLAGRERGCERAAATAAVLLADVDQFGRDGGVDLEAATFLFLRAEARGLPDALLRDAQVPPRQAQQLARTRDRLLRGGPRRDGDGADRAADRDDHALAACLLAGFPDRVAMRAQKDAREGLMVGGRGVVLPPCADGHDLVLAIRLHESGRQQRSQATVVALLDEALLQTFAPLTSVTTGELDAAQGRVVARRELRYRDLPLRSARGGELPADEARRLLQPLLAADPFRWLGEQKDLRRLAARVAFLSSRMPQLELPAFDDAAIAEAGLQLLGDGADLRSLRDADVAGLLLATWSPAQRRALHEQAPDRIALPSARHAVVDYGAPAGPTVRARMQEFFGLRTVPAIGGGAVAIVLELLAPNQRPVQVTTDLPSFWANVYPSVRRELQRRYPRHSWPEDPLAAAPEARPRKRPPS